MREFMAITKALSDENRVRVLMFLRGREMCVCQIIEMLRLAPSTVSKHLDILYQAGLVESRKDGRWIYYRLQDGKTTPRIKSVLRWLNEALSKESDIAEDAARVAAVEKMSLDDLCCRYKGKE